MKAILCPTFTFRNRIVFIFPWFQEEIRKEFIDKGSDKYLDNIEKLLKNTNGGTGWFVGEKVSVSWNYIVNTMGGWSVRNSPPPHTHTPCTPTPQPRRIGENGCSYFILFTSLIFLELSSINTAKVALYTSLIYKIKLRRNRKIHTWKIHTHVEI